MIKLSSRLINIAEHIDESDYIIDVGCDHAFLAIYLTEKFKYKKIYVSDNKQKALSNGINNINNYKLNNIIIPLLGNGLDVLIDEKVNTLIISGLGPNTINNIIKNDKIKQFKKVVIQTNKNHYYIRKLIVNLGYIINKETIVKDKNHYYLTISFIRGKKKYSYYQLKYGIHYNNNYYHYLINNYYKIINKLNSKQLFKKIKYYIEIINIKIYILKNKSK